MINELIVANPNMTIVEQKEIELRSLPIGEARGQRPDSVHLSTPKNAPRQNPASQPLFASAIDVKNAPATEIKAAD